MQTAEEKFDSLLNDHKEYNEGAYDFIYDALDYTQKYIIRDKTKQANAKEFSEGFRLYAINKFGCLAKTVLNEWGIKTTDDIGNIVFNLVEYNLMGREENDKIENFRNLYDFDKVFNLKPKFLYDYERKEWKVEYIEKNN